MLVSQTLCSMKCLVLFFYYLAVGKSGGDNEGGSRVKLLCSSGFVSKFFCTCWPVHINSSVPSMEVQTYMGPFDLPFSWCCDLSFFQMCTLFWKTVQFEIIVLLLIYGAGSLQQEGGQEMVE